MLLLPSKSVNDKIASPYDPLASLAGWSAAGLAGSCLSLGLQGRSFRSAPLSHALWALSFASFGYLVRQSRLSHIDSLEAKKDLLVKRRMHRLATATATTDSH
jgi:hypothetical protein